MLEVWEFHEIDQLAPYREDWGVLHRHTDGATFFQSLPWLQLYWKHFGKDQQLRVLVVVEDNRPIGILPLVVRRETFKIGAVRTLTFPLHDWGSFYGPIGPDPVRTLTAGLEHIRRTDRQWDLLELRWQGAPRTNPEHIRNAMQAVGFQAYRTIWDRTAVVETSGAWESYVADRKPAWLQRLRSAENKLSKQGEITYERYRPRGNACNDGDPRWDLYDACEEIARRSWQGASTDGTTLSHESVRGFLRDVHAAAAAEGGVDVNLLSIDGAPVAFLYNYCFQGHVSGIRRGYDASQSRGGAGNVLLIRALEDSFARGDYLYDLGVGSLGAKRHFQTRQLPILRFSHYPLTPARMQLIRMKRWWQQQSGNPASIVVGHVQDSMADAR